MHIPRYELTIGGSLERARRGPWVKYSTVARIVRQRDELLAKLAMLSCPPHRPRRR